METDGNSSMVNRLDEVRMSQRERKSAKAYLRKIEGMLDLFWLAGATIGSAIAWVAGRRTKTASEWKPRNA
ncbi:MAG: hypothetical protein HYU75_19525 [Betaproteobacteria bacterium]|nr:hypothetical protein [Betaproteobacteria bacterium]